MQAKKLVLDRVIRSTYNTGVHCRSRPIQRHHWGTPATAETSDTTTFGVVITPSMIEGLTVAIDYFDIEVTDAIGTIPAQSLTGVAGGAGLFCNALNRDAARQVLTQNENIAQLNFRN